MTLEFTMVIQNLKKPKTSAQHYICALVQNFEMFPGVFQNGTTLFKHFIKKARMCKHPLLFR